MIRFGSWSSDRRLSSRHALRSRRELVAERAARRALHDRLGAIEADLASAGRGDIDVGRAYQKRAKLGLAQRTEELGKATARHIELERLLVVAAHFDIDLRLGDLAERAVQGRPFAPRAALDAIADRREK